MTLSITFKKCVYPSLEGPITRGLLLSWLLFEANDRNVVIVDAQVGDNVYWL